MEKMTGMKESMGCCSSSHHEEKTAHTEEKRADEKKPKSKLATLALIGLVVGLLVFAAAQTFQINTLEKNVLSGGAVSGAARTTASSPSRSGAAAVPAMVGGC